MRFKAVPTSRRRFDRPRCNLPARCSGRRVRTSIRPAGAALGLSLGDAWITELRSLGLGSGECGARPVAYGLALLLGDSRVNMQHEARHVRAERPIIMMATAQQKARQLLPRLPQHAARGLKCAVVVAKLDRLSRDVAFISGLMARGVPFIVAELLSTPQ